MLKQQVWGKHNYVRTRTKGAIYWSFDLSIIISSGDKFS